MRHQASFAIAYKPHHFHGRLRLAIQRASNFTAKTHYNMDGQSQRRRRCQGCHLFPVRPAFNVLVY